MPLVLEQLMLDQSLTGLACWLTIDGEDEFVITRIDPRNIQRLEID